MGLDYIEIKSTSGQVYRESTLCARDFSGAVCGFGQFFYVNCALGRRRAEVIMSVLVGYVHLETGKRPVLLYTDLVVLRWWTKL